MRPAAPPANQPWSVTKNDIDVWADCVAAQHSAPAADAPATWCMWPTATACSPAASARTTAPSVSAYTVVPMSGGQSEKQVQLITDFKPDIIMVTPSYCLALAEEFETRPRSGEVFLAVGIFGAEPWTNAMRRDIEKRMGIDAVDIYGLSEVMGPGVANECVESKDGPVIWEDHFTPRSSTRRRRSAADGSEGERLTSLSGNAGHPLPHT